jgi:hypothetical protein
MMGPFNILKPRQSKWMAGFLHAEKQLKAGHRCILEDNIACSRSFGDYDQFDRGIEDYLNLIDSRKE